MDGDFAQTKMRRYLFYIGTHKDRQTNTCIYIHICNSPRWREEKNIYIRSPPLHTHARRIMRHSLRPSAAPAHRRPAGQHSHKTSRRQNPSGSPKSSTSDPAWPAPRPAPFHPGLSAPPSLIAVICLCPALASVYGPPRRWFHLFIIRSTGRVPEEKHQRSY